MTIYCSRVHGTTINCSFPFWYHGAAGKAHSDVSSFVREFGGRDLDFYLYPDGQESDEGHSARIDGILSGLKESDIVLLQYPFPYSERFVGCLVDHIHRMGGKVVVYIDDLNEWRIDGDFSSKRSILFESADAVISHSEAMWQRVSAQFQLKSNCCSVIRELSGYKTQYFKDQKRPFKKEIDYAGSLSKSQFLAKLQPDIKVNVFSNIDGQMIDYPENVFFKGNFDPEGIPYQLDGSFGLVWTSDSYPEVTGNLGLYEKFNISNKLSLYLAANLPVVVWAEAAEADFIKKNGLGLVIQNLSELSSKMEQLTNEQYDEMYLNVRKIGQLVRDGFWVKRSLMEVTEKLLLR